MNSHPTTRAAVRPSVEICRVDPAVDEALARFFHIIWGAKATGAGVAASRAAGAAANPIGSGTEILEFVFLLNGEVIGYLGSVPVSFWNGQVETPTVWLKGFMVHPDHRNGPVGSSLLKKALDVIGPSGAIAAAPAARRLFTAAGFVECGAIPNYVSILRPRRFMSRIDLAGLGMDLPSMAVAAFSRAQQMGIMALGGSALGLAQNVWKAGFGTAGLGYRIDLNGALPPSEEIDELWVAARRTLQASPVRDGKFLPWRYAPAQGSLYESATIRDRAGRLAALAVVRRPSEHGDERLRGVRVAVLSDVLFSSDEGGVGVAALKGAQQIALRMGADALLCSATFPAVNRALRTRAFIRVPSNVFLLIRDPSAGLGFPTAADQWWITRGDGKADDAF